MVRIMLILTACWGFGAAVTVALAWACALTSEFDPGRNQWVYRACRDGEGRGLYDIQARHTWGGTHYRTFQGVMRCSMGYAAVQGEPERLIPSWARQALGPWSQDHLAELTRAHYGEAQPWAHHFGEVRAWG